MLRTRDVDFPIVRPMNLKMVNPPFVMLFSMTQFLPSRSCFISTSYKYIEQKVVHSSAMYPLQ